MKDAGLLAKQITLSHFQRRCDLSTWLPSYLRYGYWWANIHLNLRLRLHLNLPNSSLTLES